MPAPRASRWAPRAPRSPPWSSSLPTGPCSPAIPRSGARCPSRAGSSGSSSAGSATGPRWWWRAGRCRPRCSRARFVARVVAEVAHREDGPAESVAVTHPVEWGEHKKALVRRRTRRRGPPRRPVPHRAAGRGHRVRERRARRGRAAPSPSTTWAAARSTPRSSARPTTARSPCSAGPAASSGSAASTSTTPCSPTSARRSATAWDALDPDDPAVQTAVAGLRRECTAAKETLSADTEVMIPVLLPGLHTMVRLGRAEFEDMIRPAVAETVEALRRAVTSAGVRPGDLDACCSSAARRGSRSSRSWCRPSSGGRSRWTPTPRRSSRRERHWPRALCTRRRRPRTTDVRGAGRAPSPPAFDAAPSTQPRLAAAAADRRPRAAGVTVAVVLGLSASVVTGIGPVAASAGRAADGTAPPRRSRWTRGPATPCCRRRGPGPRGRHPGRADDAGGTAPEQAVAAQVRPVARNVPTGASGAGRPAAPAARVVAPAPAPVVRPPAEGGSGGTGSTDGDSGGKTDGATGGKSSGDTTGGSTAGSGTGGDGAGTGTTGGGTTGGGTGGDPAGGGTTDGGTTGGARVAARPAATRPVGALRGAATPAVGDGRRHGWRHPRRRHDRWWHDRRGHDRRGHRGGREQRRWSDRG